jgi:hypothetical protein
MPRARNRRRSWSHNTLAYNLTGTILWARLSYPESMAQVRYKIPPDESELSRIKFKYTALPTEEPSIRLLTLSPGVGGNPVNCSLTTHVWDPKTGIILSSIEPEPEQEKTSYTSRHDGEASSLFQDQRLPSLGYEALSYTWEDPDQLYRITINDQIFPVTRNVLEALFFLRDRTSSRTLWIDAICINQVAVTEKGRQIRQMHRIYANASRVVVWLDIPFRNSDLAFEFAEKLYRCFPRETIHGSEGELQGNFYGQARVAPISHFIHPEYASEWLALHNLFNRPYWHRAWIFQELLMAREIIIVCGTKSTKWGPIEAAMKIVLSTSTQIRGLINSSGPIRDQQTLFPVDDRNPHRWPPHHNLSLLGLYNGRHYMKNDFCGAPFSQTMERWLELIHVRLCKYPHDKIYSLLGIAPESFARLISDPDYTQKVTNIYKQAVRAFIHGTGSLNILCFSHHSDTQDDLPSWTFDWRRLSRLHSIHDVNWGIGTESQRAWHFNALRSHRARFADDLSTLSVCGVRLGTVRYST